ncbi:putative bifunctional methylthioribulose-1-phosphate dehydratase/enolase-phosphatase E1 [Auxenochlorella protothecoides]|uniref:Putative bifunctional methylthioribulose-1-phosphate dehydratase/enolase-phosphatase E1 n=1 Tax=Auxenochlorella protothecoides TaxID=3075 RepID=A0A087SC84_AUXPR|nr:putative bifunctional methylthioribulose-1-phosphate dehydratase/enolase-phosphatase E1 [Auxenochlorella protothecoides]KFM23338.1 putative bifunctional methylthioribulose-1-phosphate dehydratase/enolase-phosphatase E1 [Auxenochlorella protothecoides]
MTTVEEAKHLICDLCGVMYAGGHVSGTGGGISIKAGDALVMAPSGVQKERMRPEDMFVLDLKGNVTHTPEPRGPPYKPPKLSECAPLFQSVRAYDLAGAGAVLHSHSINALLATVLDPDSSEFRVTELEMIKGIEGHGFFDTLVVPIIENTARECELTERLQAAIRAYPRTRAVLVRRHGVYVWGRDWIQAKTQAECYEYLFEAAVRLRQLGLDASRPAVGVEDAGRPGAAPLDVSAPGPKRAARGVPPAVVLDIEGTVAPISYVTATLFPYARVRLRSHLEASWGTPATQAVVQQLRQQTPALKTLQGHIWTEGFATGELTCPLFPDVAPALRRWAGAGIKLYIYSSGSRQAQRDLFGHTADGDLRPLLSGFFDTSSGAKVEAASYENIALSLGVDSADEVLFATDSLAEARAAGAAGWRVALTLRPGNAPVSKEDGACLLRIASLADLEF